jgi:hypothetical protein
VLEEYVFGWKLIRESEFKLIREMADMELKHAIAERDAAREYAAKAEAFLDHERERIDAERERADRMADNIFQANGLPAVSPTVLAEEREATKTTQKNIEDYRKQVEEIFGETLEELEEAGAENILEEAENAKS